MIPRILGWIAFVPPRERLGWAALLALGAVTALLEGAAAILMYGLVAVLTDEHAASQPSLVVWLGQQVAQLGGASTPVVFALVATGILVLKNGVQLLAAAGRARIGGRTGAAISTRALRAYLTAPYVFHLRRNSAELSQNLLTAVPTLVGLFDSLVTFATETLVVGGLLILLCRVAWFETLVATVVILGPLVPFVRLSRGAYARLGARNYELGLILHRALNQAFGAVKELKVLGRERSFYEVAERTLQMRARTATSHAALENVPRLLTETAFVVGMLALVVILTGRAARGGALLPFVGLYAYAGFRIVPAAHRIALHASTIRYALSMTAALGRDLAALPSTDEAPGGTNETRMPFDEAIRLEHVFYTYQEADAPTLRDIDVTIRRGACMGIVGATGTGKSTLVDLVLGLLEPTAGRITVDHAPISADVRGWQRQLGYVPQSPFFVDDTLRRNIGLGLPDQQIDDDRIWSSARTAQLEELIASLPGGLDTVIGERGVRLSGGERQRVSIARALYHDPDVLVFDEATSSLDPSTERDLTRAIDLLRGRKTIVIIAHRLTTVEHCDRLLLLKDGRVAAEGSYAELAGTNAVFRAMAAMEPAGAARHSSSS